MTLAQMREAIPVFHCRPGCFDCCGPVPFSQEEWKAIKDKRKATSLTCPYASEQGCAIYDDRPMICRLYGTVADLRCPHGCAPANLLSAAMHRRIMASYLRTLARPGLAISLADNPADSSFHVTTR